MDIDERAQTFGLPKCLIIPIAAKNEQAIKKYVGQTKEISLRTQNKAFHVKYNGPLEPIDKTLPIWELPESETLHAKDQVWVHVDYVSYRSAYLQIIHKPDLDDYVIDHIVNRRFARLLGYNYVRLCAVTREVNTSSGRGPENESVKFQETPKGEEWRDQAQMIYADPSDIVKMLNIKTGHFPLDGVRRSLYLMYHSSKKPED